METEFSEDERKRAMLWVSEYRQATAESERRERQVAALYELMRSIPHTDADRLLQRIAERVVSAMDAHTCSLLLRDRGGEVLRMAASVGLSQDVADSVTLLVGERIAGRVAATGQPILINKDPNSHPMLAPKEGDAVAIKRREEVESSLCSPLCGADGEVHGVMCLSRLAPSIPFTESDLRIFSLFASQAGAVIAQQHIVEDLTRVAEETAQMDREVARHSHLAALGQFAATVAHELRNPLSSIKGAAQFLLREFSDEPVGDDDERTAMLRDFLTIVVDEVNGLSRLTTDLLEFARPTPTKPERCDLCETLRSEITFLIPELAGVGLAAVHQNYEARSPAWAAVDAKQLGQALRNLVFNAAQAAVSISEDSGAEVKVSLVERDSWYEIKVEDNGPGVPEELGERLWEPFFTTKAKGSGLGLAQVRRVVEDHGGLVGYENMPGSGASFTILLPRLMMVESDTEDFLSELPHNR